jgi:serine/threonine protein kinase
MPLTSGQLARLSLLLDEALTLDGAARRRWLESLAPEHQDLAPALWSVLLRDVNQTSGGDPLSTLPKLGSAEVASNVTASGLQPGARVGPYELIRLLGAGGMAEVWLARRADGAFKRDVALKLPMLNRMRKDLEQRFVRERDILASLEHANIARLYDAGVDPEGLPYLSMEYVQGQPLTVWCDRKRIGIPERLALFLQVLDAVQYAHEKHVIHRDLKPSNILVTDSGQVRLLDFGVAKLLETEETDETQLTRVYGRALTPDYASPELLRGEPVDARGDIYSLGVLLYAFLTGALPYRLNTGAWLGMLEQAIAAVEVKRPSTQVEQGASATRAMTPEQLTQKLRGDLDAITLKALTKGPKERYQSAQEFAEDLKRHLTSKPITAQPPRLDYRLGKFVRRHRTGLGVAVTFTAVMVATVGYEMHRETVDRATDLPPIVNAKPLGDKSVAVLPFVDLSEKKDQEYFAEGLSEELIDLLAQTQDLQVIARTSSFYFKGKQATIADIARALGVASVLEGSVRKAGDTIRVTAQLIRADNGVNLWSQRFDRDLKDVFKVQDEIAASVVAALKLKLAPAQQLFSSHRTANTEAYNEYLLGRQFHDRTNLDGYTRAVAAYRKAIVLDPNYSAPYAYLAFAEAYLADFASDPRAANQQALADAERAVTLAPDQAGGYVARGYFRAINNWDWAGAETDLERALAFDAGDITAQRRYAWLLASVGRLPEAIAAAKNATRLDPLSHSAWQYLGYYLLGNREFPAAREAIGRALEIHPENSFALKDLGILQLLERDAQEALATFRQNKLEIFRLAGVAMAEHTLGQTIASQQALGQLIAKHTQDGADQIAQVYAWRGEKDHSFEWLEQAYKQHDGGLSSVKFDLLLSSLRDDPRYKALLHKLNLPE